MLLDLKKEPFDAPMRARFRAGGDPKITATTAIVLFLTGEGSDHRGRSIEDVLALDDSALERNHDYIQWLFPLSEASRFNPHAPILDAADSAAIGTNSAAQANLRRARDRMLTFYRRNDHWLMAFDHNHLRITRIIRCLGLCSGVEEAKGFHNEILALVEAAGNPVNAEVLRYWREAVFGARASNSGRH